MKLLETLRPYTKTITAFVVGLLQILSLYITLNADGRLSAEDQNALIGAVVIALGGTGLVYQLPNRNVAVK